MNKKFTYSVGFDTGYSIANSNISELDCQDWNTKKIDNFISECSDTESEHYRQFSPFEFFAHDINECYNSESLWEGYDQGVYNGILKRVKEFKRDNKKGYQAIDDILNL